MAAKETVKRPIAGLDMVAEDLALDPAVELPAPEPAVRAPELVEVVLDDMEPPLALLPLVPVVLPDPFDPLPELLATGAAVAVGEVRSRQCLEAITRGKELTIGILDREGTGRGVNLGSVGGIDHLYLDEGKTIRCDIQSGWTN